jgi:uncharacterized phiE125 gp8 family phage protein
MSFYSYDISSGQLPRKTGTLIARSLPADGNRIYVVETPPDIEPVTLDELKAFARIKYTSEDTLLEGFITAARMAAEEYTGRAFISQTIKMLMDYWPGDVIDLPKPPLASITSIATLDEDDAETEYTSDNYYAVTAAVPGRIVLRQSVTAPINTSRDYTGFLIRYVAGYGDAAADVPGPIKEGIKVWASIIQATRTIDPKNPPPEARVFLDLYRLRSTMLR